MQGRFYKLKRNKIFSGVLAGLADKFSWDLSLLRFLYLIFSVFNVILGGLIYFILSESLPYKEDLEDELFGRAPRKLKEANRIEDKTRWFK